MWTCPYKRKCWTNSVVALVNSLLWGLPSFSQCEDISGWCLLRISLTNAKGGIFDRSQDEEISGTCRLIDEDSSNLCNVGRSLTRCNMKLCLTNAKKHISLTDPILTRVPYWCNTQVSLTDKWYSTVYIIQVSLSDTVRTHKRKTCKNYENTGTGQLGCNFCPNLRHFMHTSLFYIN